MGIKIALLRGGNMPHHERSLRTGEDILSNLPSHFDVLDIYVDQEGHWHIKGLPIDPAHLPKMADIAFNTMRYSEGSDRIHSFFEKHSLPFVGSSAIAESLSENKASSKQLYKQAGIKSPYYRILEKKDFSSTMPRDIFTTFPFPAIVKPVARTYGEHIHKVETLKELTDSLENLFSIFDKLIIEEFLKGRVASVGIAKDFRDKEHYAFVPLEKENQTFKYPGSFSREEASQIEQAAIAAHKALGLGQFSASDFLIHPRRGVYILGSHGEPDFANESLFDQSLKIVGSDRTQFLEHLINLANSKK